MTSKKIKKHPLFIAQYSEFNIKVGLPIEICKTPLIIDGLFEPYLWRNRLSLGFLVNMDRRLESLECLINIGLGIQLYVDETNNFMARSFSKQPIFVVFRREQYRLDLGEIVVFYDLNSLFEHKILPKKVGKVYDEFGFKISFGQPFRVNADNSLSSACCLDFALNRIVELPD